MLKRFQILAMLFVTLFSLSACGDDDNDDDNGGLGSSTIVINGKEYQLSPMINLGGYWDDGDGQFAVTVVGEGQALKYYVFSFESDSRPRKGDNFAKMSLSLKPLDSQYDWMAPDLPYVSGSAVVKSIGSGAITVQFSNLKMAEDGVSYTFNGTATVPFED